MPTPIGAAGLPSASSAFRPMAAGLRAAADARLAREALGSGGLGSPGLDRALEGIEAQGRTLVSAAVLKLANDQAGQVLDLLA